MTYESLEDSFLFDICMSLDDGQIDRHTDSLSGIGKLVADSDRMTDKN